jgi:hypothetical protein
MFLTRTLLVNGRPFLFLMMKVMTMHSIVLSMVCMIVLVTCLVLLFLVTLYVSLGIRAWNDKSLLTNF